MSFIFWYQGQAWYRQHEVGGQVLYVSPTRIYCPEDGRFLERDLVERVGAARYQAYGGAPVSRLDPGGMDDLAVEEWSANQRSEDDQFTHTLSSVGRAGPRFIGYIDQSEPGQVYIPTPPGWENLHSSHNRWIRRGVYTQGFQYIKISTQLIESKVNSCDCRDVDWPRWARANHPTILAEKQRQQANISFMKSMFSLAATGAAIKSINIAIRSASASTRLFHHTSKESLDAIATVAKEGRHAGSHVVFAGAEGRVWASPVLCKDSSIVMRVFYTGRMRAKSTRAVVEFSDDAAAAFQPHTVQGPISLWKAAGRQHYTRMGKDLKILEFKRISDTHIRVTAIESVAQASGSIFARRTLQGGQAGYLVRQFLAEPAVALGIWGAWEVSTNPKKAAKVAELLGPLDQPNALDRLFQRR